MCCGCASLLQTEEQNDQRGIVPGFLGCKNGGGAEVQMKLHKLYGKWTQLSPPPPPTTSNIWSGSFSSFHTSIPQVVQVLLAAPPSKEEDRAFLSFFAAFKDRVRTITKVCDILRTSLLRCIFFPPAAAAASPAKWLLLLVMCSFQVCVFSRHVYVRKATYVQCKSELL